MKRTDGYYTAPKNDVARKLGDANVAIV